MDNESFYLTVNSNTPNPSGGENKPQKFTVKTLVDQSLNGEWEVGLTSFRYPNSWYNVPKNMIITITIHLGLRKTEDLSTRHNGIEGDIESGSSQTLDNNNNVASPPPASSQGTQNPEQPTPLNILDNPQSDTPSISNSSPTNSQSGQQSSARQSSNFTISHQFGIPAGNYDSIDSIVETLTNAQRHLTFIFNPITKRVSILPVTTARGKDISISIGPNETLMNLLGFKSDAEQTTIKMDGRRIDAAYEASLSLHFPAIYLYSDVVKHQFVNGMMAQLLFDDTISGEKHEYTERRIGPKDAMYLAVGKKYISQLEFEIRDDTGELIQFQAGKVQIRLHFRPKLI